MKQGEQWIIFYVDGARLDWTEVTDPWEVPRTRVGVIASSHPESGYVNIHGADYFYYEEDKGGWQTANLPDVILHLQRAATPLVLFGEMMADHDYVIFFGETQATLREHYGWKYVRTPEKTFT